MVLTAGTVMDGHLGASLIQFDQASPCHASDAGGTSCRYTRDPGIYSGILSDAVRLASPPQANDLSRVLLPVRDLPAPEDRPIAPLDPFTNNRYGIYLLAFKTKAEDPTDSTPGIFPSTTLVLTIDHTRPYPHDAPAASFTVSFTTLIDSSGGIVSTSLEPNFDPVAPVKDPENKSIYSLVPDLLLIPAGRRF